MGNSRSVELTAAVAAAQEGVSSLFHSGCTVSRMVRPCHLILYPMSRDQYHLLDFGRYQKQFRVSHEDEVLEAVLYMCVQTMLEAAGAVSAGAVADRLLGPREQQQIAIILVGLPARGNTFTAAKLTRYLCWLGHDTKHFNVGKYRRLKLGSSQSADFFRGDNKEGIDARNEFLLWRTCLHGWRREDRLASLMPPTAQMHIGTCF